MGIITNGGGGGGGAMTQLGDTTLGVAGASITVSAIGAGSNHLYCIATIRTATAAVKDSMNLTFNGDTGANYMDAGISVLAGVTGGFGDTARAFINAGDCPGANATANFYGSGIIFIPLYAGTAHVKVCNTGATQIGATTPNTNFSSIWGGGTWNNTAAITSISIAAASAANIAAGSRLTVYGYT